MKAIAVLLGLVLLSGCGSDSTFVMKSGIKAARASFPLLAQPLSFDPGTRLAGSPTTFSVKFYGAYLSTEASCAAPHVEVANFRPDGTSFDVVGTPTIFSASPAAATYKCLILEISDVMTFQANAAAETAHNPACPQNTDHTFDILRAGDPDSNSWKTKTGETITGAGSVTTPAESSATVSGTATPGITAYATTDRAAAITAGAYTNQVLDLAAAITVTDATTTLTLLNDVNDKISTNSGECWMEPGTLTIQ